MIGWLVAWKCAVAWRFGESSQQPTWPQVRHRRRCTHQSPVCRHSSQPSALGVTSAMPDSCGQTSGIGGLLLDYAVGQESVERGNDLCAIAGGSGDTFHRTRTHIADREYAPP